MTHWQVNRALPRQSLNAIEQAIAASESAHAGEIRFAVEGALDGTPLFKGQSARERAIDVFSQLRIWDTDPEALEKFVRNLTPLGFDITVATSAADAVTGADIITTCTADKALATVLTSDLVAPGVHINAIGGDCPGKTELEAAILDRASVFVEYPPQTRVEGEIQQMASDFPVTELWRVIVGTEPGRTSAEQI